MPETKTIREWLNELPEPYRSEAIENAENDVPCTINDTKPSLVKALYSAFTWMDTPQGHDYWSELIDKLCTPPTDK